MKVLTKIIILVADWPNHQTSLIVDDTGELPYKEMTGETPSVILASEMVFEYTGQRLFTDGGWLTMEQLRPVENGSLYLGYAGFISKEFLVKSPKLVPLELFEKEDIKGAVDVELVRKARRCCGI